MDTLLLPSATGGIFPRKNQLSIHPFLTPRYNILNRKNHLPSQNSKTYHIHGCQLRQPYIHNTENFNQRQLYRLRKYRAHKCVCSEINPMMSFTPDLSAAHRLQRSFRITCGTQCIALRSTRPFSNLSRSSDQNSVFNRTMSAHGQCAQRGAWLYSLPVLIHK